MANPVHVIPPLDPSLHTAQVRALGGPARVGSITYDTGFTTSDTPSGVFEYARWIYVGTTGNLSYVTWSGNTITLPGLAAGIWHPIFAVSVNTTGTTIAANQLFWGS